MSPHTQRAYATDLRQYVQMAPDGTLGEGLSGGAIEAWRCHMEASSLAAATIRRRLATLRALTRWLEREGAIADDPFRRLKAEIRLPKRLPRNLGRRDLRLLLKGIAGAGEGDMTRLLVRFTVELLLTTGLRIGEACSITLKDLKSALLNFEWAMRPAG